MRRRPALGRTGGAANEVRVQGRVVGFGRTAEIREWGDGRVVKLFRAGFPYSAVEAEATAAALAHSVGVPTPAVFETVEIEGRRGIVFERVSGPTMLEGTARQPWMLPHHARRLAELQARLHLLGAPGLPNLRDRLAQIVERSPALAPNQKAAIVRHLADLPDGDAVCHGDFHPDNVILTENGPVVIDWMNAASGHPAADAARTAITLRLSLPPEGRVPAWIAVGRRLFYQLYLNRYLRVGPVAADELRAWELPVTAARLSEGLPPGETKALYDLVTSRLDGIPANPGSPTAAA